MGKQGGNFLTQGLYADQLRGIDATGVALVDKDNNVSVYKRALAASDFIHTNMGVRAIDAAEKSFVAIGHNRASTIGKTIDETSHPFDFEGRFVGAHNGTITGYRTILPVEKYPVDSMNLIASFDKVGNLHDVLKKIHTGSYAVVVYDKEEEKLLFARNDDRPLHIVQGNGYILWASEAAMLYWIAHRNNLLDKDSRFIEVPTEQVVSYDCNYMTFDKPTKFKTVDKPAWDNTNYGNGYGSQVGSTVGRTVDSDIRGGQVHGVHYHFNMGKKDIEEVLDIDTNDVMFWPAQFMPHGNKEASKRGQLHGYIFDDTDGTLFPCSIFNIDKDMYEESLTQGKFLIIEIINGYFTKEGNIVHLVGINPTLDTDDSNPSIWDKEFDVIYTQKSTWIPGISFSLMLNTPITNIQDPNIKKAYILKSSNRIITKTALEGIKFKPARSDNNKESDSKKVTSINKKDSQSTKQKSTKDTSKASTKNQKESTEMQRLDEVVSDGYDNPNQSSFLDNVPGPDGLITPARFSILTRGGCCICSSSIYVDDAEMIKWLYAHQPAPVCADCAVENEYLSYLGVDPSSLLDPVEVVKAV